MNNLLKGQLIWTNHTEDIQDQKGCVFLRHPEVTQNDYIIYNKHFFALDGKMKLGQSWGSVSSRIKQAIIGSISKQLFKNIPMPMYMKIVFILESFYMTHSNPHSHHAIFQSNFKNNKRRHFKLETLH